MRTIAPRIATLLLAFALACDHGAPASPDAAPTAAVPADLPATSAAPPSPAAAALAPTSTAPEGDAAVAEPPKVVGSASAQPVDATAGADALRPSDLRGLCEKVDACGCPEAPSTEACVEKLVGLAQVPSSVVACIGEQRCKALCAGQGEACIRSWADAASAQSKAAHDTVMGVIDNYPGGSACPSGYRASGGVCVPR